MSRDDPAGWLARGQAHRAGGRPVEALLCFERAAKLAPADAQAHFLLGEAHWQLGAVDDARAAWRKATDADPAHRPARLALAEAALALGDLPAAADTVAAALARAPQDAHAGWLELVCALAQGDATRWEALGERLAAGPGVLASPHVAAALAPRLDGGGVPTRAWVALAAHAGTLGLPLLAPLARAAFAPDAGALLVERRSALTAAALARPVLPPEVDVLRVVALAAAGTEDATVLAARYAQACAALVPSAPPLLWPLRTAGAPLRVVALLDAAAAALPALAEAARAVPGSAWQIVILNDNLGPLPPALAGAETVVAAPGEPALAARLAARDPDVLVDCAGLAAPAGPLLAQRPARRLWALPGAAPPQRPPLVDDVVAAGALGARLAALAAEVATGPSCALEAAALAARFAAALRSHQAGELPAARAAYEALLALQPAHAATLHAYGALRAGEGEHAQALALLRRAVDAAPSFVEARASLVRAARDAGDAAAAQAAVDEGLARDAGVATLWRLQGELALARDDLAAAGEALGRALALAPRDPEVHYNLGVAQLRAGHAQEAARAWQRALVFDPGFADAHYNLGVLLQRAGRGDAALGAYRAVLARDPRRAAAYRAMGEVLYAEGRLDAWLANFGRFEAQCPDALPLAVYALEACQYAADFERLEHYLAGLAKERYRARDATELVDALEQLQYLLLFFDVDQEILFRFARTYDHTAPQVYGTPLPRPAARRPGKLRIGYLSADLRNHVMGKMMWEAVRHHDRARFALHFYSLSTVRDAWTERYAGLADRYTVIAGLDERAAARRIAEDDLDLLVDLSGHTKGGKPGILAQKPARVQIAHVASAGSVGLSAVDFKLTDKRADLPAAQEWMVERLLAMEGCVYPFRRVAPAVAHPYHRAALGIPSDAVVIGAFVTPMKLSRRCLGLWREVLARVPRARLAFSPAHPAHRPAYERLAAAAGIAGERLLFLPQGRDDAENQARYAVVDFVLDPMPFGGVNGVIEPLDAGVPVVALLGRKHGERSAASILAALGVTQTVADGGRDYVDLAVRLAEDAAFARSVREAIAAGLASSPLVDGPAHTRHLEDAYLAALREKAPGVVEDAARG